MSDKTDFKLIKLDKDNYVVWKWQFKNVLNAKRLEDVLKFEEGCLRNATRDNQAMALLGSALSEENILKIINCETFEQAWKAIESCYENKTAYEPQALYRKLNSFKIMNANEMSQGLSEMKGIVAQLKNLGETVSDNCLAGAILSALPSSFEVFSTIWKHSADKNINNLVAQLMAEALDQASKDNNEAKALATKNKGKPIKKVSKNQCRYCKEEGHWVKDCPSLKGRYDPNHSKKKKPNEKHDDKNAGEELAFITTTSNSSYPDDIWVADSGCTNHMTPFKHLFLDMREDGLLGYIAMADSNSSVEVRGKGDILTKYGKLQNVLYVPNLAQSLFSISAAASKGLSHIGSRDKLTFYHGDRELFSAKLKDKLYLIKLKAKYQYDLGKGYGATLEEWHSRFGHVSKETIKMMMKNKVVDGLDVASEIKTICEDCSLSKCTRAHHPLRTTPKAKIAGNVLHVDTAGPSKTTSRGNSRYFILCKDEFSKYRLVSFVNTKDLIPNKVKEFISKATLDTGNQVLKLVSDNGSEFCNQDLSSFLAARGIIHDKSAPYVPNQNGFIERDIRTIKESAKTMLNKSKLDKNLWPEAVSCAVYVSNRVINSNDSMKTPYELWFGAKANVKNLRTFGELAILKKSDQKIIGWNEKGEKGIFLNYTDRFNTYKFLVNNKFVITCDATFMNKMWDENMIIPIRYEDEGFWVSGNVAEADNNNGGHMQIDDDNDDHLSPPEEIWNECSPNNEEYQTQNQQDSILLDVVDEDPSNTTTGMSETSSVNPPQISRSKLPSAVTRLTVRGSPRGIFRREETRFYINEGKDNAQKIWYKDIYYDDNTRCWRDKKTAKFLSNAIVKRIQDYVAEKQGSAQVATALVAANDVIIPKSYEDVC